MNDGGASASSVGTAELGDDIGDDIGAGAVDEIDTGSTVVGVVVLFLLGGTSYLNPALVCKALAVSPQLSGFVCDFDVSVPTMYLLCMIAASDFPQLHQTSMAYACFLDLVSHRLDRCVKTYPEVARMLSYHIVPLICFSVKLFHSRPLCWTQDMALIVAVLTQ